MVVSIFAVAFPTSLRCVRSAFPVLTVADNPQDIQRVCAWFSAILSAMHHGGEQRQRRRQTQPAKEARGASHRVPEQESRGRHAADTPQKWPEHWFEPRPSAGTVKHRREVRAPKPAPPSVHGRGRGADRRRQPASTSTYVWRAAAAVVGALLLLCGLFRAFGVNGASEEETVATVVPSESTTQAMGEVAPSRPLEMTVPNVNLHANFEPNICQYKNGAIDPSTLSEACVYTAEDRPYSLPGTNAPDIVVVAGHAAAGVPAIFDKLYDPGNERHSVTIGDALYVRTEASGDRWLKYQATDLHEPEKTALSQSQDIWGTAPIPGRLLTITCIQPANPFAPSVKNAVVGWQFQGVVGADETRL